MLVSIVVPIYNTSLFLEKCLESIKNQTYSNIEVILVDDGSTDGSGEIAEKYAIEDVRFRIIHLENGGVSRARNKGIELATGKYITFIDSDDYVDDRHIENLIKYISADSVMCICNYIRRYSDRDELGILNSPVGELEREYVVENLLGVYEGYSCTKLFDLDVLRDNNIFFEEKIKLCEDLLFVLTYILKADGKIAYSDFATYYYFQRDDGATARFSSETSFTSIIARRKCIQLLRQYMPKAIYNWEKVTLFVCFSFKKQCISNKVKLDEYQEIVDETINELYESVYRRASFKEKFKLFLYKYGIGMIVLIKKL